MWTASFEGSARQPGPVANRLRLRLYTAALAGTRSLQAAQLWPRISPDVVILDLMLPGLSGLELLRRRRRAGDHTAVIVLSARGEEEDRLIGLETGADDYVVKPFSPPPWRDVQQGGIAASSVGLGVR
jgi:DNA-binding response OmpR family regulator